MTALPPATTSPKEFMENWLPKAIAEAGLPENAKTVDVRLGIRLEGAGGGDWIFHLQDGSVTVTPGPTEDAAFTLIQSVDDWRGALWEGRGGAFGKQASGLFRPNSPQQQVGAAAARPLDAAALGRLQALRGMIRMVVAGGPGGDWKVNFKLGPGPIPAEPNTTVTISAEDASAMERGELDPMQAFMAGRIQIAGDMALMMQMQVAAM
jgi:putative sterol carrier protein